MECSHHVCNWRPHSVREIIASFSSPDSAAQPWHNQGSYSTSLSLRDRPIFCSICSRAPLCNNALRPRLPRWDKNLFGDPLSSLYRRVRSGPPGHLRYLRVCGPVRDLRWIDHNEVYALDGQDSTVIPATPLVVRFYHHPVPPLCVAPERIFILVIQRYHRYSFFDMCAPFYHLHGPLICVGTSEPATADLLPSFGEGMIYQPLDGC